ncbi:paraquat-inducible protein A [Herbaspirillum sp. NPDC087042]|uniref:paraquat-inducible protein A n=1 Tax=Herbaspirillum sp. NPDC087042 TaxID=3364004 RepID=UPI00381124B6
MTARPDEPPASPPWIAEATLQDLVACPCCDGIHLRAPLQEGEAALCQRCDALLYRVPARGTDMRLPLVLAAAVFLVTSHLWPIAEVNLQGVSLPLTLWGCIALMQAGRMLPIALLMLVTTIVLPAIELSLMVAGLIAPRPPRPPRSPCTPLLAGRGQRLLRCLRQLRPWIITELYMLGMLLALYQASAMGTLVIGIAASASGLLAIVLVAILFLDSDHRWP